MADARASVIGIFEFDTRAGRRPYSIFGTRVSWSIYIIPKPTFNLYSVRFVIV